MDHPVIGLSRLSDQLSLHSVTKALVDGFTKGGGGEGGKWSRGVKTSS